MFFSPASILGIWFRGLLSIAILAGGIYLLYCWQAAPPTATAVDRPVFERPAQDEPAETRDPPRFGDLREDWRPAWDESTAMLAGGLVLLAWGLLGGWIYPRPFRRSDGEGLDRDSTGGGESLRLNRPDGTVLNVECHGPADAPRLILTHGWGCDRRMWRPVQRQFADSYRIVVWDLPGLGASSEPQNRDYSIAKMANDLRAVIEATGEQPAILVGHSIGGMISLTLCGLFTDLKRGPVAGLVLAHTTYTNPLKTMSYSALLIMIQKPILEPLISLTILLSPLVWLMNGLSYLNGSAHRSTERQSFSGNETRGQLDFAARYSVKASPKVVARGVRGMLRYDVTSALADIKVPAMVIVGDRDLTTKPEAGRYLKAQIPNASLATLTPAKHLGFFEHHESFHQSLQHFASETFAGRLAAKSRVPT